MVEVEERLFMGKRIVDIWGKPETVLSIMDDLLSIDGFHLIQLHTFQAMPFYHAFLEFVPVKEKWHKRLFNDGKNKGGRINPVYERVQKEGEENRLQQGIDKDAKALGKGLRRMQIL